jgi:hypothetical protein
MMNTAISIVPLARVNGAALCAPGERVRPAELRQRACTELLRQYLRVLAGQAAVEGVDLDSAETTLVQ